MYEQVNQTSKQRLWLVAGLLLLLTLTDRRTLGSLWGKAGNALKRWK